MKTLTDLLVNIPPLPWEDYATSNDVRQARLMEHYKTHAANVLPDVVSALRAAIEILKMDFDYRPDDEDGSGWTEIKNALDKAENFRPDA